MWLKFLYFLRMFRAFGYLIRLIIDVVYDMRHFLVVLSLTIIAFGDTFYVISNGNIENSQFVKGFLDSIMYTYLIILGGFNVDDFEKSIATSVLLVFFFLCTLFNTIVMLNLLIAIISDTFSKVKENQINTSYQEMAAMIAENAYLVPDRVRRSYAQRDRYLVMVSGLEDEIGKESERDQVRKAIEGLKHKMMGRIDKTGRSLEVMKNTVTKQEEFNHR